MYVVWGPATGSDFKRNRIESDCRRHLRNREPPKIKDGKNQGIKVTGSYIVIKKVHVTFGVAATKTVNGCAQPVGDYYGVNMTGGAHHITLKDSVIEKANAGVHLSAQSRHITVTNNTIRDNGVMNVFGGDPSKDLGAWGILVRSNNNKISHNVLRNNRAKCASSNGRIHSNSVEIFEGSNNYIHHNKSFGDRVFSELGGSAAEKASDNVFEFNLHNSDLRDARFITTRGGKSSWGPVWRTTLEHNTVVLKGPGAVAVSCGKGCSGSILTARGNIFWAEKSLYADANFNESDNVYWSSRGQTNIQVGSTNKWYDKKTSVLNGSVVANPTLQNVGSGNFRPGTGSPAHNRADTTDPSATVDLGRQTSIINGKRDSGAYETG